MENTFNLETFERTGATLNAKESLFLFRMVSGMTQDQLYALGFNDEECETIQMWYYDYTR